jgi:hypothetical protein
MAIEIKPAFQSAIADDPAALAAGEVTPSRWNAALAWSGLTAGQIPYPSSATALTDSANLTYSEASGPRLQVGSGSTTTQGWIFGYEGTNSGYSAMWRTGITPSASNYAIRYTNGALALNAEGAGGSVDLSVNNATVVYCDSVGLHSRTAGKGIVIPAGTATTDVNALSVTQTWNAAGVAFTGWRFTITDTASAAGALAMQILGGASGTTSLFKVTKGGKVDAPAYAVNGTDGLASFNGAVTNITVVNGIVTAAS